MLSTRDPDAQIFLKNNHTGEKYVSLFLTIFLSDFLSLEKQMQSQVPPPARNKITQTSQFGIIYF
jgi:hypothetical protein